MPTLQEQRATLLDQARTIIDGAKDRDLTDAEQTQATAYLDQVSGLDASIKASERSGAIIHKFENAYSPDSADQDGPAEFGSKHLSLRGVPAKAFSAFRPAGSKAVISTGSVVLGTELLPAIQPGSRAPLSLLEAIPAVQRTAVYRYLQESAFTPNAGVVAPGGTKPVSAITITSVDDHLRVVATLSDAVDRFALEDSSTLQQYLSSTLSYAVQRAIEDQVVNGTGVGEEFHGWASQSGVQVVPAAPDLISGLRSAITSLQGVGIVPSFFAVAPGDFEAAQLARNSSGAFDWAVDGSPVNAGRQQAWGVAVVPTAAVPAGTAWAVGQGAVQLSTDGQMRVDWGTPGTAFEQNQLVARAETRANQDILRPSGLVKVTLTAGA